MSAPAEVEIRGAYERLNEQRRNFVDAYIGKAGGNAKRAAELAGYCHPMQSGWRLKHTPEVAAAITERVSELAMSAEEVMGRLAQIACGDMGDVFDIDRRTGQPKKLNLKRAQEEGALGLIQELSFTEHGPKVKLYSRIDALKLIGQHHKLFTERHEHDIPADLDARIGRLVARVAAAGQGGAPEEAGSGDGEGESATGF